MFFLNMFLIPQILLSNDSEFLSPMKEALYTYMFAYMQTKHHVRYR